MMILTLSVFVVIGALLALFLLVGQPIASLAQVPHQVGQLLHGLLVRRNHAIQHATVNVLEERYGPSDLDGYATTEGFHIRGKIDPALLFDAAREGLLRLQRGDRALAIQRRCATTLAAGHVSVAATLLAVIAASHAFSPLNLALVALLAMALAPKLSRLLQRITTSMDVKGMGIGSIELVPPRRVFGLLLAEGVEFAVRIKPARRIYQPPYRYGERVPVYVPSERQHQR